jgi:cytosine/uracil/thiamine/allantoin permease
LAGLAAGVLALLSAFFVFWTVRLLVVTRGLQGIRAGGQGAYAGAVVFPLLALVLGWGAWRCARGPRLPGSGRR